MSSGKFFSHCWPLRRQIFLNKNKLLYFKAIGANRVQTDGNKTKYCLLRYQLFSFWARFPT